MKRRTHPWPQTTVAWAETANDLRKDDKVGGNQWCRTVDGGYVLDEIWHQFAGLEVGVGSGSPSDDFEVSSGHGGEKEIPHLVPDRLAKVNG